MTRSLIFLFAFCCAAIVANLYYAQTIIDLIAQDVGMSARVFSLIVSLTQIGYACGLFLLVPLGDVLENRRLVMVMTSISAISLAVAAMARDATTFLIVSLLIGVSSVSVQMLVPLAANRAPPETRGRVVGTIMSGLLLGILLSRPLASFVTDLYGWRTVFGGASVLMLVMVALQGLAMPISLPPVRASYPRLLASLWTLFSREPVLRRRSFYQGCLFASFTLFWTAVPIELARRHGLSHSQIAVFALVGAMGGIAAPVGGRLADAGRTRIASLVALTGAALCYLPGLVSSAFPIVVLAATGVVLDFCVQMNMVLGQREIYALDPKSRSRLNALYMTSIFIGGATGAALASTLYQHGGWPWIVAAGSGFAALALAGFLIEMRRGGRRPAVA